MLGTKHNVQRDDYVLDVEIINKMDFRGKCIIILVVIFMFNITEFECSKNSTKRSGNKNRTHVSPVPTMTTMDFGVSAVVDNASDVFRKIIAKMLAKKKLVGFESGWYW